MQSFWSGYQLTNLTYFLLVFLPSSYALSVITQHCIYQPDGSQLCNNVPALITTIRIGPSPCYKTDLACWSVKAMEYTNEVRKNQKVETLLVQGPLRQLDNAVKYARKLFRRGGKLKHQNLHSVTKAVRCKRWIGGENVAFNYARGDVAQACVWQWLHSKTHRQNLLRGWFREVVIGFHFGRHGKVYCVQTFSLVHDTGTFGSLNGKGCERVRSETKRKLKRRARRKLRRRRRTRALKCRRKRGPSFMRVKRARAVIGCGTIADDRSCHCLQVGRFCCRSLRVDPGFCCNPSKSVTGRCKRYRRLCCGYCKLYSHKPV